MIIPQTSWCYRGVAVQRLIKIAAAAAAALVLLFTPTSARADSHTVRTLTKALADLLYAPLGAPILATTCTNQFISAIAATGAGTCTGLTLAGAQFANQGSTTTLLHGNAAGNPSWAAVVSADLNITGTTCTNQVLTAISSAAAGTCSTVTLASAQFANQGTTTTVLHGNAAGNPSFGKVVDGDVTFTAPALGAPTATTVQTSGNVGVGVAPSGTTGLLLDALLAGNQSTIIKVRNTDAVSTGAIALLNALADSADVRVQAHGTGRIVSRFGVTIGGYGEVISATGGLLVGTTSATQTIIGANSIAGINLNGTTAIPSFPIGATIQGSTLKLDGTAQSLAAYTTTGADFSVLARSITDTSSSGTVAVNAVNAIAAPTLLASSAATYTDSSSLQITGPPVASTNVTQTRAHTLSIVDSTSAASSITGGLVVATTLGTTATSVGIGGGNLNAGGNGTFGGTLSVTGHTTFEGVTSTGATGTAKLVYSTAPTLDTTVQIGGANAASPVAGAIQNSSARGGTDTNTAGTALAPKIIASLGTGTGVPGTGTLQGGALGTASGTTAHTAIDRFIWNASKTLSNNSTTTTANVTDAADTSAAVLVDYAVEVNDGASHHQQVEVGTVACSVVNTNGVFSGNTCTKHGNQQSISASGGTLTVTWTITGANPALLQINSNTATITPSMIRVTYSIQNLTQQAIAIQ